MVELAIPLESLCSLELLLRLFSCSVLAVPTVSTPSAWVSFSLLFGQGCVFVSMQLFLLLALVCLFVIFSDFLTNCSVWSSESIFKVPGSGRSVGTFVPLFLDERVILFPLTTGLDTAI